MTKSTNTNINKVTITSVMEAKAIIPEYEKGKDQFVSYQLEDQQIYTDEIVKENFQGIFTSIVQAQKNGGNIIIKMASVVNGDSLINDYNLTYDFSLNSLGEPQINIYLLLKKPQNFRLIDTKAVTCNFYKIDFTDKVDLSEFNTVEIFLASEITGKPEPTRSVVATIFEV